MTADDNNLIGLTDANGNTHTFTFSRADRMLTEARPMGQTIVYGYDAAGQLIQRTDPMGHRAEYNYDPAGRRIEVRHFHHGDPDTPERVVTFDHDESGRLIGYDDGMMSGEYAYDPLGRKTEETVVVPGQGVIAFTEYQRLQPTRIEFPGGTVRESTYDGLQRHTSIRVTSPSGQTLMDYQYTWDETGNIREKATEHGPYRYDYDDIDRLVEAEYPTFSAEEWTYDPLGNRITDGRTGEDPWQYNDNNELLSCVEYTFEYDENGSLIAEYHPDGSLYRSHEYNAETRLSAVRDANGDLIAEYSYDPFGRRAKTKNKNQDMQSAGQSRW